MERYTSIPTEELLRRCAAPGDTAAWQEFVRRFHRTIASVITRVAARWGDWSRQTADDLVQETYVKLCAHNFRTLRDFEHRTPEAFVACIKVIAANVVHDHFKSSYSQKRGSNKIDGIEERTVVAARAHADGGQAAIERGALIQDVQRHLDQMLAGPDRNRNTRIFWLYFRVGLSAASIAELPGIDLGTKGVESLIFRLTRDLRVRLATRPAPANIPAEPLEGIFPAESF